MDDSHLRITNELEIIKYLQGLRLSVYKCYGPALIVMMIII
jgi:hypothetical protein